MGRAAQLSCFLVEIGAEAERSYFWALPCCLGAGLPVWPAAPQGGAQHTSCEIGAKPLCSPSLFLHPHCGL